MVMFDVHAVLLLLLFSGQPLIPDLATEPEIEIVYEEFDWICITNRTYNGSVFRYVFFWKVLATGELAPVAKVAMSGNDIEFGYANGMFELRFMDEDEPKCGRVCRSEIFDIINIECGYGDMPSIDWAFRGMKPPVVAP